MNGTVLLASTYGAYSTTAYAPTSDISSLVLNDLSQAYVQMGTPLPNNYSSVNGLNTGYSYARVVGSRVSGWMPYSVTHSVLARL